MPARQSPNPKRRIAPPGHLSEAEVESLPRQHPYTGSANHKSNPREDSYGFHPPANPRPHKSLCDDQGSVSKQQALRLFLLAIRKSMVSTYHEGDLPKYVWSVDDQTGEVFEAKWDREGYHGYRLSENRDWAMRKLVLREWNAR